MAMSFPTPAATSQAPSSSAPYTSKSSFLANGLNPLETSALNNTEDNCCICLEHYTCEDPASRVTPCGHMFHTPCMMEWVESGSSTCPMCRAQLFTPPTRTSKANNNNNNNPRRANERRVPSLPRFYTSFGVQAELRMASLGLGSGMGGNFQPTREAPLDY